MLRPRCLRGKAARACACALFLGAAILIAAQAISVAVIRPARTRTPAACSSVSLSGSHAATPGGFHGDVMVNLATANSNPNNRLLFVNTSGPGQFQFSSATYQAAEGSGSVTATVYRVGGSAGTATVRITVTNGTAT